MKPILYALLLTAPLLLSPAQAAEAPRLTVTMDADSYSARETLLGQPPLATVTLVDEEGAPLVGVPVRVVFLRQVQLVGYVSNETVSGVTNAEGTFTVPAPSASSAPGTYLVIARADGFVAQARYTVGA